MNRISSGKTRAVIIVGLIVMERVAGWLLDMDFGPGLEAGLLLLWGIGHCDTLDGPLVTLAQKRSMRRT